MEIWRGRLDDKYDVVVHSSEDDRYAGELVITENSKFIARRTVSISYGALFGPDMADVLDWESIAIGIVDGL